MKKYLSLFWVLLFLCLPVVASAQEPDAFTDGLLQEISKMEEKSRAKVGAMAPRKDTIWGRTVWLEGNLDSISKVVDQMLLEKGLLTELTPRSSQDIDVGDYEYTILFMSIVQATTDALERNQFVLPEGVICEDIKTGGKTWGYFDPYGFGPGCSVATPKDFADVRRLITKHNSVMRETWGIAMPENFLPWNCPRYDFPPPYGKQLWGIILRYGLPTVPTETPRPGRRTPTATSTSVPTATPTGTLTPQPTVTGTRQPTATPTPTPISDSKGPWVPIRQPSAIALWIVMGILLVAVVITMLAYRISHFETKVRSDIALVWTCVSIGIIAFEYFKVVIVYYLPSIIGLGR